MTSVLPVELHLSDLLAPMSVATFANSYWEQRSVYIKGEDAKFTDLFGLCRLVQCLTHKLTLEHMRWAPSASILFHEATASVFPADAQVLWQAGLPVRCGNVSANDQVLRALALRVKCALGFRGSVRFDSLVLPSGTGHNLRVESCALMVLHIDGSIEAQFGERPALDWPDDAEARRTRLPPGEAIALQKFLLGPGDLVFLPAGTWHMFHATTDSLVLVLAFDPGIGLWGVFSQVLGEHLRASPRWRGPGHLVMVDDYRTDEFRRSELSNLRAELEMVSECARGIAADPTLLDAFLERISRIAP